MYVLGQNNQGLIEYSLSTPWRVSTASPTGVTTSIVLTQDSVPQDLCIKYDGTKLYTVGSTNDRVYEFTLSTPWNFQTVGFTTYHQLRGETFPTGIDFTADGSRFVISGQTDDTLYEYTLNTPWSVATAVGPNTSFSVALEEATSNGVTIDPTGSYMYIVGTTGDAIREYQLSSAFDVRTARYTGNSYATGESTPTDIFVRPDGSQIFVIGSGTQDWVRTYNLSTPFNLSTASVGSTFSVASQDTVPEGLWFKSDGSEMYVSGDTNDRIYQYTLGTPWNVTTAGLTTSYPLRAYTTPSAVAISTTGETMYVLSRNGQSVNQYTLSTPFNVGVATGITTSFFVGSNESNPTGLAFNQTGTVMYITGETSDRIYQYSLSTPWNVSTAIVDQSVKIGYLDGSSTSVKFSDGGTKLFFTGSTSNGRVFQFGLKTPYMLSSAYYEKQSTFSDLYATINGLYVGNYNSKLYVSGTTQNTSFANVWEYNLNTPADISGLKSENDSFVLAYQDATPQGITFRPDGLRMFMVGSSTNSGTVFQYDLTSPWDIRTARFAKRFRLNGSSSILNNLGIAETAPQSISFKSDGTILYVVGNISDKVYAFELSSPWSIDAAIRLIGEYSIAPHEATSRALTFSTDGTLMYILGDSAVGISQFRLSTPWNINTAVYQKRYTITPAFPSTLYGLSFTADGTKFYVCGLSANYIAEYYLQTPWQIDTAAFNDRLTISSVVSTDFKSVYITGDRKYIFAIDASTLRVIKYRVPTQNTVLGSDVEITGSLTVDEDVNIYGKLKGYRAEVNKLGIGTDSNKESVDLVLRRTAQIPTIGIRSDISNLQVFSEIATLRQLNVPGLSNTTGFSFKSDGTRLYVLDSGLYNILEYSLSKPWDVKTAKYETYYYLEGISGASSRVIGPGGFAFRPDGRSFYVSVYGPSNYDPQIIQYDLSIPWVTTSARPSKTLNLSSFINIDYVRGIIFNTSGSKLYCITNNAQLVEFTLTTAWDISNVTLSSSYNTQFVIGSNTMRCGLQFSPNGKELYIFRTGVNYAVSTPSLYKFNLRTAFDLSTINYSGISVPLFQYNVQSAYFRSNGKELYTISDSDAQIKKYTLTTAWDITTIKQPASIGAAAGNSALAFKPDGTQIITGNWYVYDLKVPWDISTIDYLNSYRYIPGNDGTSLSSNAPYSIFFRDDGLKAYGVVYTENLSAASRSYIVEYTLYSPWDLTTIRTTYTYIDAGLRLTGITNSDIMSVELNKDGTKLYVVDYYYQSIYEYDLLVPWSLASIRRTEPRYNVTVESGTPYSVGFGTDGRRMYINGNGTIYQYDVLEPYDIRTAEYTGITTTTFGTTNTRDVGFSGDGSRFYTLDLNTDRIYQYNLVDSGNIYLSTTAPTTSFSVTSQETNPNGFTFGNDGKTLYVVGTTNDRVYQYGLTTAYNIDSAGFTTSFSVTNQENTPLKVKLSSDGTRMYTVGTQNSRVHQYGLSTSWYVDSAGLTTSFYVGNEESTPNGLDFSPDGRKMYIVGTTYDVVLQYDLSTPWEIGSASYNKTSLYVGTSNIGLLNPRQIKFEDDGYTAYILFTPSSTTTQIQQYDLQVPWRIATAGFTTSYLFRGFNSPSAFQFNGSKDKLYVIDSYGSNAEVIEFDFKKTKTTISGGLEVYGTSKFNSAIDVKGKSTFENIGIGTTSSPFSALTVAGNANLEYISSNEFNISNYTRTENSYWLPKYNLFDKDILPHDIVFGNDGKKMYICEQDQDLVQQYSLTTPWDIRTAKPENGLHVKLASPNSDSTPVGIAFSTTGYSLYVLDDLNATNRGVRQYTLSTPWEVSSAGFTTFFNVNSQETSPASVGFSTGGDKMYVLGLSGVDITEYNLSNPWRVDSATHVTQSSSLSSQGSNPNGMFIKPDGKSIWIVNGTTNASIIYEYGLRTPWSISTLYYNNKFIRLSETGELNATGIYFDDNGKSFYLTGTTLDRVWKYNLATAWDITTATIDRQSTWLVNQSNGLLEGSPGGLCISPLGHKLYVSGTGGQVYEYDLPKPWNVGIVSYTGNYFSNTIGDGATSYEVRTSSDGTKFYVIDTTYKKLNEYTLTIPWNTNTAVFTNSMYWGRELGNAYSFDFNSRGTRLYIAGENGYIWEYSLSTALALNTATLVSDSYGLQENLFSRTTTPLNVTFSEDGYRMYWVGSTNDRINQVDLNTKWQVNTGTNSGEYRLGFDPYGIVFKPDGNVVYVADYNGKLIRQYNVPTAWDINSITGLSTQFSTASPVPNYNPSGLTFNDTGTIMYVLDYTGGNVNQYTLSSAWNVDSATFSRTVSVSNVGATNGYVAEPNPRGIRFSADGKTLYISGSNSGRIHQYKLEIAWDVSSRRRYFGYYSPPFNNDFYVANTALGDVAYGMYLSPDETKLYVTSGTTSNRVWQFELTTPGDIRTAKILSKGFFTTYLFNTGSYIESTIFGLTIASSGRKMYIVGQTGGVSGFDKIQEFDLTVPERIDSAVLTNRYLDIQDYESAPTGIFLKSDGTKIYMVGSTKDVVWEFDIPSRDTQITGNTLQHGSIEVEYKVSSSELKSDYASLRNVAVGKSEFKYQNALTVSGKSDIRQIQNSEGFDKFRRNFDRLYVGNEDISPVGISIKPDGTKLYVTGSNSEELNEYDLATPWDLKTASFVRVKALSGTTNINGLVIKPDGTEFYFVDENTNLVYQYTATVPWNVASVGFTTSYDATSQDTDLTGISIIGVGTTMYLCGDSSNTIYQYSLSTPWNVSTASLTTSFGVGANDLTPRGVYVKDDGAKMFVVGDTNDRVYEYSLSTPGNVSTASLTTSFYVNPYGTTPTGLTFKPDGTKLYVVDNDIDSVTSFDLSTAWSVSPSTTKTPFGILSVGKDGNTTPYGVYFRPDGKKLFVLEHNDASQDIYEYDLTTAWDFRTASTPTIHNLSENYFDITFKPDGTKMYLTNYDNASTSAINEFTLTSPWDVTTRTSSGSFTTGGDDTQPYGVEFVPDGTRFYVCGQQNEYVYPYEMTTPWTISTARRVSEDVSITSQENTPTGLAFSPTGDRMYVVGSQNDRIYQYNIPYGYYWDVRYVTGVSTSYSVTSQDATPQGIAFKPDGTTVYMIGNTSDTVYQYGLTTAWNVSTASLTTSFLVSGQTNDPREIKFHENGEYMYVLDGQNYNVIQYKLGTPWNVSTASTVSNSSLYLGLINAVSTAPTFEFGKNGERLYVSSNNNYRTYQFNLTDPWNVKSAVLISSFLHYREVNKTDTSVQSMVFKPDGTQFSLIGQTFDRVTTYKLKTPWEISTAYYDGDWVSYDRENTSSYYGRAMNYVRFNNDGTKMYGLQGPSDAGGVTNQIFEFDLTEPYKLWSAKPTRKSYSLYRDSAYLSYFGLYISPDNSRFYVVNGGAYSVFQYSLPSETVKILNNTEIDGTLNATNIVSPIIETSNLILSGGLNVAGSQTSGISTGNANGSTTLSASLGNYFKYTATGNYTILFSSIPANKAYFATLELTNGGLYTATWSSAIKWPGGVAPTLSSSGTDVLTFVSSDGGINIRGILSIADSL